MQFRSLDVDGVTHCLGLQNTRRIILDIEKLSSGHRLVKPHIR